MAYKTDGTANFNFFINRQGPRGPQGIEGEEGFSPTITEGENTADTYTLQVNNKDGSFTTPNLKPQLQDRGGDVVKVDRENDTLYFGTVDVPNAVDLTSDQTINGNKTFLGNSTFNGKTTFNGDTWTKTQEAEILTVNNSATFKNMYVTGTLSSVGEISAVYINTAGIKNNQNNKYYLNQGSITAGNNITIEETAEGVKINSTASGGGGGTNAGLEGDYCSRYGIVDCPNGILVEGTKKVTLKAGVVMQMTETDGLTTNASDMAHDITSTVDFDLFYTSGSLLEATQVVFAEQEPDNGDTGVLAWFNGTKWQFKSNSTGNVWKSAPAVRLAHIHITNGNITRIDYIGNRHLNKVIPVTTDGAQTITGAKTFTSNITTSNDITFSAENVGIVAKSGRRILFTTNNDLYIGSTYNKTIIRGTSIQNLGGKKFLVQGSITAGSDNLVIAETDDGIKLVVNAPTDAQLAQLQEFIVDLSTKINNLTDRVTALEQQIDGGVA